ncbi:Flp family type IVb pilin [Thalassovita mangrovi]|uniref:Flp family type IVb pilin n=1 Tax=Thalassovita mangrovi TaxID=2692236 RepID=A0A6L8LHN6_9RHOB|nr:hypothetical protein [Thalassovita mangrovi]MYM55283.1 hypothetical protein [Thalassovita mangrovi]
MNFVTLYIADVIRRLRADDDGLALTEYLVVLGLLIGGVIAAVILFGDNLSAAWTAWAGWLDDQLGTPPAVVE